MEIKKRLIDANALRERHCGECKEDIREMCRTDPVCAALMWVDEEPTVDAVEVVHGYNLKQEDWGDDGFECSVCGYEDWDCMTCEPKHHNYCPNCGAKMDSEKDNQKQ